MEVVEYAPDVELHEKLRFEWPEGVGLTLDDFEVYHMWPAGSPSEYYLKCPLWLAVCEPEECTRNLRDWLFVAINKSIEEIEGLYFVRSVIAPHIFDFVDRQMNGWYAPVITHKHLSGMLFSEYTDAILFKMWKDAY